jgi:hypothetical protein
MDFRGRLSPFDARPYGKHVGSTRNKTGLIIETQIARQGDAMLTATPGPSAAVDSYMLLKTATKDLVPYGTAYGWTTKGISGKKLPVIRVGGRIYTRRSDVVAYLAAINSPETESVLTPA